MSEPKFTSGPWHWHRYGNEHYLCNDTEAADGEFPRGIVHSDGSACGEYSPDIDVNGPDAALIAAAPNMYYKLAEVLNSSMAMREEDEGQVSPLLASIRELLAEIRQEAPDAP